MLDVEGTAFDAGVMVGHAWRDALHQQAAARPADLPPFWQAKPLRKLVERFAPHLPDLFQGMAKGAELPEDRVGTRVLPDVAGGCTSFAVQPRAALDALPLSGQTKDTPASRIMRFVVLRLKLSNAPSVLTLTYPGWLFGHGFVEGGCSIFRNSLYAGAETGGLPYTVWGLLALHCKRVADVVELARRHGVDTASHTTVADEEGGALGIEIGRGGIGVCRPKAGIYVHANAVRSGQRLQQHENCGRSFSRENSLHRETRLRELLERDAGRLTAQLAYMAMCDHQNFPKSLCRHESTNAMTTAAVVAEPTRGLLHVSRGSPCQNWPVTYRL